MPPRRRLLVVVIALATAYVATLGATAWLRDDSTRPLYDGFAPRARYRFVDPPSFYEPGNVEPEGVRATLRLDDRGTRPATISTPDGQFVLTLGRGAIEPSPGATRVVVRVTPVAPAEPEQLPDRLRPNGNVYRLRMTYEPSGRAVSTFERPADLVMSIPEVGNFLFRGRQGAWRRVASTAVPPRQLDLSSTIRSPGDYLGATDLPELVGSTPESSSAVPVAIGVGIATIALVAFGWLLVRRRRTTNSSRQADPSSE